MTEKIEIMNLLQIREFLEHELKSLLCGSIEIREKNDKRYIYVHYREDGRLLTKYVGEYSDDLNNQIINNNFMSKGIKKQIRNISKELKKLNYHDETIDIKVENNIDFAHKHLAETIYKQAKLEGVVVTLSDTENIIEGSKVNNMTPQDIMKVVNLKHAWEFILNKNVILSPTNYALLCEINKLVLEGFYYNGGKLRVLPVQIGGTKWIPDIPNEINVKNNLNDIVKLNDDLNIAIELLLYVTRMQLFVDGNKRTSVIFANHYLISKGLGLIVIPEKLVEKYKKLLIDYYESNNNEKIKAFLKEKCYIKVEG